MRRIDADELQKAFTEECCGCCDCCSHSMTGYKCELIDNAPTVEITEEQAIDKLHETGWLPLHDKEMTERPTGEWKEHDFKTCGGLGDWDYKCSNCEKVYCGKSNYCPNCGARMTQGGNR